MWRWLLRRLGLAPSPAGGPPARKGKAQPAAPAPAPAEAGPGAAAGAFLRQVAHPPAAVELADLAPDDRLFVSGILKRLNRKDLEIPVLPRAAVEISRLLSRPNAQAADLVRVLTRDPRLSLEVLRLANSAHYGFARPTRSLRDAVVRVGIRPVRDLVVLAHLKGKVLQTGAFFREANELSDLSLALGHLARHLARDLGVEPDAAFTRGLLAHTEHFLVLSAGLQVSKEHRRAVQPSAAGVFEALRRYGGAIRALCAAAWELEEVLSPTEEGDPYPPLRAALVAARLGEEELPAVPGVAEERLGEALARVAARWVRPAPSQSAGT
ncbi:MAG: hypothetical protein Kow0092_02720 [Deferrisomatales bacterium]